MNRIPFYRRKPDKFDGYDFAEDLMPDYQTFNDDESSNKDKIEIQNKLEDNDIMF